MSGGTSAEGSGQRVQTGAGDAAALASNGSATPSPTRVHQSDRTDLWWGWALAAYLLGIGCWGGIRFVNLACACQGKTSADCTLELAAWAGMLGGFVHASQSLVDYMGNRTLHRSWALWYLLRPLQGAVVGAAFYIIARAGLISSAGEVNVYGVSALGLLGGWFSKNASDKMKEVFETLFGKGADASRANKMSDDAGKPDATSSTSTQ